MRLRLSGAEACANGAWVGYGGLVERADGSTETGLRHVAEGAGLIPLNGKLFVVKDYFPEQSDLLKVVQRYRLGLVERISLDAVDLLFDSLDFLPSCNWNTILIICAV